METTPAPPDQHPHDYPVVLSVAGRRCLVVGGGPVAARKARGLLTSGARVTVVAPRVNEAIGGLASTTDPASPTPGSLEVERRAYRRGEAAGFYLVATATGVPVVDASVVSDAVSAGVLVDSADGDVPGTIRLPAIHREGSVTVAVSTGGASPALARWLRDRIAASLPPETATLAELLGEARLALRDAGRPAGSVDWAVVLDEQVVPLVEAGRVAEARSLLLGLGDQGRPPPPR
jgi:siroheme synthase-like protein